MNTIATKTARRAAVLFISTEIAKAMRGEPVDETNALPLAIQSILKDKAAVRDTALLTMRTLGEVAVAQVKRKMEAGK